MERGALHGVSCAPPPLTLTAKGNRLQGSVVLQQGGFLLLWDRAKETPGQPSPRVTPTGTGRSWAAGPLGESWRSGHGHEGGCAPREGMCPEQRA